MHAVGFIMRVPVARAAKGSGLMRRYQQNNEEFGYGLMISGTGRLDHQHPVWYMQNPHKTKMLKQILARAQGSAGTST